HQFTKVEQFVVCKPEDSWKHFDELLANAEEILQHLKLPYRVVAICSGDIGNVASKKIDLEVWMPASGQYREVVSCSNVLSYQAARLNIKFGDTYKKEFVHTINSTAIATTRMIVAIMENFQNEDGSFNVPEALHPYLHGIKKIP
ncbi:MAG TPA: aminoacyl--tRNA ligase-related protein, partial [Candidatus Nanoarchaeia archaeon]|nr:aminoacyl--tRNA ligase-related protein [Candidatus Nanoarchaeia archaeon]